MSDSSRGSLRETIADAYEEVTSNEAGNNPEQVVEGTIPTEPKISEVASQEPKPSRVDGRARDEKGRLLPGKAEKQEVAPVVEAVPTKPRPPRPSSWKKEYWDHYEKLDPNLAEYLVQRENEYAKGVSTYKAEYDQVKPFAEAVQQFLPELRAANIRPEQWISNLGNAHRALAKGAPEEKLSMFLKLAQDYQVPVQQLFARGEDGQIYFNPQVQQIPQRTQQPSVDIESHVKRVLLEQSTAQEIQNFATATDDKGQLKHPHFDAVRATMQGLLQAELATDIVDAYKQAIMHPRHSEIGASIRQQEEKEAADRKAQEQRDAVARARQKVISPRGSTPQVTDNQKPKGVRAAIESAYDSVVGGNRV